MNTALFRFLFCLSIAGMALLSDEPAPAQSPEVHPNRTITFRLQNPGAKEVVLAL
jgi:hypothetical protein